MSFDPDYGPYRGHPQDPRTPEDIDRYDWEAENGYTDLLSPCAIDEILYELLYGEPQTAREITGKHLEAAFEKYLEDSKRQDKEDIAAARAEARADNRYWEAA